MRREREENLSWKTVGEDRTGGRALRVESQHDLAMIDAFRSSLSRSGEPTLGNALFDIGLLLLVHPLTLQRRSFVEDWIGDRVCQSAVLLDPSKNTFPMRDIPDAISSKAVRERKAARLSRHLERLATRIDGEIATSGP